MDSPQERRVHIVGPHHLSNALLAFFLEATLEVRCSIDEQPPQAEQEGEPRSKGSPHVVLLDCLDQAREALLEQLRGQAGLFSSSDFWALFNLDKSLALEQEALTLGLRGFFYLRDTLENLSKGVKSLLQGDLWVPRQTLAQSYLNSRPHLPPSPQATPVPGLTDRELEILQSLASGRTNRSIAEQFCISPHTVKTHIYNIFRKIKVKNRLQAVQWLQHTPQA